MVPQARGFYSSVLLVDFCALASRNWIVRPYLAFRFKGDIKYPPGVPPEALINSEQYFSFWQSHREEMIHGGRERELVATEWWDVWANAGIVRSDDRNEIRRNFTEKQKVNVCPGWLLEYRLPLKEAEGLDDQRISTTETAFSLAVREKIREAFRAMGQDFDDLVKPEQP
jgi:hypothetical protein